MDAIVGLFMLLVLLAVILVPPVFAWHVIKQILALRKRVKTLEEADTSVLPCEGKAETMPEVSALV